LQEIEEKGVLEEQANANETEKTQRETTEPARK